MDTQGFKKKKASLENQISKWEKIVIDFPKAITYAETLHRLRQQLAELNSSIGANK